ncbi:hypothetical protein EXS70_03360 [Candidatus Peribacteria bacterium]|nr:hypothetical protein [Candidatus Peribacteria bacterium]
MRPRSAFAIVSLLCSLMHVQGVGAFSATLTTYSFAAPVDAVSVRITGETPQAVSAWDGSQWTEWQGLTVENEQDPALRESNLVMLPPGTTTVRFQAEIGHADIHPIHVSTAPTTFTVAALADGKPRILSRQEWGADDSFLVVEEDEKPTSPMSAQDNGDVAAVQGPTQPTVNREQECRDAQAHFPAEFKASTAVTENAKGEKLRWPLTFSTQVKLLVVHHTALSTTGDQRSGLERVRALYTYHANNRGWGDVGYHYLIDEQGQIYEGRTGGDSVVGGHTYCNNIGTVGVALMGNFDLEEPTQVQAKSLQWLLQVLGSKYHIDMTRSVVFHGKSLSPIVGHRQLVSTDCPGFAMWSALDQVRTNVRTGQVDTAVEFPHVAEPIKVPITGSGASKIITGEDGLAVLGDTVIQGRPGGEVIVPLFFRAGRKSYTQNTRIARITRGSNLQMWQEREGVFIPIRGDLRIPIPLVKKGESILLRVKVRLPMSPGTWPVKIGTLQYMFETSGRRVRTMQLINTRQTTQTLQENGTTATQQQRTTQVRAVVSTEQTGDSSPTVRIHLTNAFPANVGTVTVRAPGAIRVNGTQFQGGIFALRRNGEMCQLSSGGQTVDAPVVRLEPGEDVLTIEAEGTAPKRYRGFLECRVLDNALVLINELQLESYLMGLGEEPDTEPLEKQRAFAIAARTYATYYLDPDHRKFAGKPYDGSDSPATFQLYKGYDFELQNPKWVRMARETAGQVLSYNGQVIKPPYFSSDDGRTRTPAEAHWGDFPFAGIFSSKPDPWCKGMALRGHGVGMSGCGAKAQALEGRTGEEILNYYYPGTVINN